MELETKTVEHGRDSIFSDLRNTEDLEPDQEGNVTIGGPRFNIMGAEYFMAGTLEVLRETYGEGAGGIIKNSGRDYGEEIVDIVYTDRDPQRQFGYVLGFLKFLGYSHPEVEDGSISFSSSPTAEAHRKDYGEDGHVCYFLGGILTGAASKIFDEEVVFHETECIAEGDDSCVFEMK
ncbi:MAG: V4R domain-containing protein [Candidatus Nanohaloarchaea archaeon]